MQLSITYILELPLTFRLWNISITLEVQVGTEYLLTHKHCTSWIHSLLVCCSHGHLVTDSSVNFVSTETVCDESLGQNGTRKIIHINITACSHIFHQASMLQFLILPFPSGAATNIILILILFIICVFLCGHYSLYVCFYVDMGSLKCTVILVCAVHTRGNRRWRVCESCDLRKFWRIENGPSPCHIEKWKEISAVTAHVRLAGKSCLSSVMPDRLHTWLDSRRQASSPILGKARLYLSMTRKHKVGHTSTLAGHCTSQ